MASGWNDKRPMSPHLQVWRWHPTMLSSILHRATGIVLYISMFAICLFLAVIAAGPTTFVKLKSVIYSPFGAFVFFGVIGVIAYHLFNGLRHLVWDAGKGYDPKLSNTVSIVIIIAAAATAAFLTAIMVGSL